MGRMLILAAALALPGVARAADPTDKPIVGPAAAWIIPAALPTDTAKPDEAAVRLLLTDQQVRLTPAGAEIYTESLLRVQTPQGLQALGNITLPWKPDTSTLTVHKLRILRGAQVIDLLANGGGFTVLRRENKLEYATLDGVLTAVIQPEGLQVGDMVDVALTITSRDPVLAGHPEGSLAGWANLPIAHVRSRAVWDSKLPIRWRAIDGTPPVRESKAAGTTEISLAADALEPLLYPKDAPARFRLPRLVEMTSFASWCDLAALFAPLYAKAATLTPGSPLAGEVARIAAASSDPVARTEAALALVQDQVRYVFLGMNDGGLMPAAADATWQRRFGDCKGKTALLLTMLHALGIAAEPALISTAFGDGLDQRLPMVALFDHILVRTTIGGKVYWLDGTRMGDRRLADIVVPPFRWALPVRPSGATLERLTQVAATRPFTTVALRIDATAGLTRPAPMHAETVLRGDAATQLKLNLANLAPEQRDRGLRDFWTGKYDFATVTAATATYDDKTGEERLAMDGTAVMDWSSNSYEADGVGVGWTADFSRPPGSHQDASFAVTFPAYERTTETILLPNGGNGFAIDTPDVDRTLAGVEYHRKARLTGGTYTVEMSARTVIPEFPASDAAAYQAALRALAKQRVFVNKRDYRPTDKERAAVIRTQPKTAREFMDRAAAHFQKAEWRAAISDYDRAIDLDGKLAEAFSWRGTAHTRLAQLAEAKADYARALALDPRQVEAGLGQARIALMESRWADARAATEAVLAIDARNAEALLDRVSADRMLNDPARLATDRAELVQQAPPLVAAEAAGLMGDYAGTVAATSAVIAEEPGNVQALGMRATAQYRMGHYADALADTIAALKADPKQIDAYLLQANILRAMGRHDEVARVASDIIARNPDNDYAHVVAAAIYRREHRPDDAAREFARAIEIKPTVSAYLTRADSRPKDDVAGRRGDLTAASRLEPASPDVAKARVRLELDAGNYGEALASADAGLRASPENGGLHLYRGLVRAKLGRDDADADFAAARAMAGGNPTALNEACWQKATHGVALASALADCDAALKIEQGSAQIMDSRAFVLLRLGRFPEAIEAYDAAIRTRPTQAGSLYGRGLAKLRLGRKAEADADLAAARDIDPNVRAEFARYGITA